MAILYLLEGLRTPFLNLLMLALTIAGEETAFIAIGLLFFWCVDKKEGYYILTVGFIGTIFNQFMKIICRVPRPWVKNPDFTIVEAARAGATGYSFPSGHTQSSIGVFGSIARWSGRKAVKIFCGFLCVLIPFSRMYLGVHTPQDVLCSAAAACVLIFALYPLMNRAFENRKLMWGIIFFITAISGIYLLFTENFNFPANIDSENLSSAVQNGYTLFGCGCGLLLVYYIDEYHSHFETRAPLPAQILKFTLGMIIVIALKEGLKIPLSAIMGESGAARAVRYFTVVTVAGGVWPLTFGFFSRIGGKRNISPT